MIFRSLKWPTIDGFTKVKNISLIISLIFSLAISIPSYLSFTDQTKENILNNFPHKAPSIIVARVILAFVMWLTYPMEMFVAREVINESFLNNEHDRNNLKHISITVFLALVTYFIALFFGDRLGIVLELTVQEN